jgi:hypothetical protein
MCICCTDFSALRSAFNRALKRRSAFASGYTSTTDAGTVGTVLLAAEAAILDDERVETIL